MASLGIGIIISGSNTSSELDQVCIVQNYEIFNTCNIISGSVHIPSELDEVVIYKSYQFATSEKENVKPYRNPESIVENNQIVKEGV
jgi:hypothetical protein